MAGEIVVLVTCPPGAKARSIGERLVEERLAACVNLIPRVRSIFRWKGKICHENEVLMVVKTRQACYPKLLSRVKRLHPYTVPEIIALPIQKGSQDYLKWIREMTK